MPVRVSNEFFIAPVRSDKGFCDWYVEDFMKTHLPANYFGVSATGKREMVLNGRNYAKQRRLEDPQSQAHFITLMWQVGADFFLHPGFAEIFDRTDLTAADKIDLCYNVPKDQAVAAMMQADPLYWYPEMVARRDRATS